MRTKKVGNVLEKLNSNFDIYDIELKKYLKNVTSENYIFIAGIIYSYKGILIAFGLLLAYETRSVKLDKINDSRLVRNPFLRIEGFGVH